jgi:hypothetical protein
MSGEVERQAETDTERLIREVDKSQDLQSENWRLWRANFSFQVQREEKN